MSDDLIAGAKWTLENAAGMTLENEEVRQLCDMADRIEELEANLAKQEALMAAGFAEYERRLAKAVEEAEKYQQAFAAQSRKLQAVLHIDGVRVILAELTGGKDE